MRNLSIYDLPTIYDRVVLRGPCENFYTDLASKVGGPVLELACGTGRLTIPLARAGQRVVGIDTSAAMLDLGRSKAHAEGVEVSFQHGDMRNFDVGELFSLIIVSCNSMAHLTTNEDVQECLARVRHHLAPGGILAFDIVNPDIRALAMPERIRLDVGPILGSGIAVEEFSSYDPVRQVRVLHWRIRDSDLRERELAPLILRQFFPQEVPLLLHCAGLELGERYGSFAGDALSADSLNQVCVAGTRS